MKKFTAFALTVTLSLGLFAGMFTVADAAISDDIVPIPLNYLDAEDDWYQPDDAQLSPKVFKGTVPSGGFVADTKQQGGNPNDPISAAKDADDYYLKLENNLKAKDNYVDIIRFRPKGAWNRYELKAGVENIIIISMDVASPGASGGTALSIGSSCVGTSQTTGASNDINWGGGTADIKSGKLGSKTIVDNTWYNVTIEIGSETNGRAYKVYVDGELIKDEELQHRPASAGGPANPENTPMWLGLVRTGVQDQSNVHQIYYDNVYINYGEAYTPQRYHVNRDAADLGFSDFKKENVNKDSITSDLELLSNYPGMDAGTTITWESDAEDVIDPATGAVTLGAVETVVTLTATIANGSLKNTKSFRVTVPQQMNIPGEGDPAKKELYDLCVFSAYKASNGYTTESFGVFRVALNNAIAVLGKDNPAKADLDEALEALTDSINGLEIPDKGTLGSIKQTELDSIDFMQYINNTSLDKITNDLKELPAETAVEHYPLTWTSSNPEYMDNNGKFVARPKEDTVVSMIATIDADGVKNSKAFEMTLYRDTSSWSDLDFINGELKLLEFEDFCDQDPAMIVTPITLPPYVTIDDGVTFSWSVSDTTVASVTNNVARFTPRKDSKASLELIVTASRGNTSNTKSFPITLIRAFGDNLVVTQAAKISASGGSTPYGTATRDFESYWESDAGEENPAITFDFGKATAANAALLCERGNNIAGFEVQTSADKKEWTTVYTGRTLGDKARNPFELGDVSARYYRVVITAKADAAKNVSLYSVELFNEAVTDSLAVAMDKASIVIPSVANSDITLPTVGKYGSTISWSSSKSSVISDKGKVTPGSSTEYVTLTAFIKKGDYSDTVSGDVKVPVNANISFGGGGSGGGGGGNGSYNTYKPSPAEPEQTPSAEQEVSFSDLSQSHWAYGYVIDLLNRGIVSKDSNFRPEDSITREEFLKMLVISMGLKTETRGVVFADVAENEWYHKYVVTAALNEIVTGIGDGTFGIGMPITRQDMAVMAERALDKYGKLNEKSDLSKYSDRDNISEYARNAAGSLTAMGIMNGSDDGRFMPDSNTTRAEAAKIISLLYDVLNS